MQCGGAMLMRILELTHPLLLYMQLGRYPLVNLMNPSWRTRHVTNERTDISTPCSGLKKTIKKEKKPCSCGSTISNGGVLRQWNMNMVRVHRNKASSVWGKSEMSPGRPGPEDKWHLPARAISLTSRLLCSLVFLYSLAWPYRPSWPQS